VRLVVLGLASVLTVGCMSVERESARHYAWMKRGETLGNLIYIYCTEGTRQDRLTMEWAAARRSYPALATIDCRDQAHHQYRLEPAPPPVVPVPVP
jgi:hypothetical protein